MQEKGDTGHDDRSGSTRETPYQETQWGKSHESEASYPALSGELRESIDAMSRALRGDMLQAPTGQSPDSWRAVRRQAILLAHDTAQRFIDAHSFRHRDPSFLKGTLDELTRGIDALDSAFCEAATEDYLNATSSIRAIAGLPPEIIKRQTAKAYARVAEQQEFKLNQLTDLVEEFRKWGESLISEVIGNETGLQNTEVTRP